MCESCHIVNSRVSEVVVPATCSWVVFSGSLLRLISLKITLSNANIAILSNNSSTFVPIQRERETRKTDRKTGLDIQ